MNGSKSPIWSSLSILIGAIVAILAIVRGKWQLPLLILAAGVWAFWLLRPIVLPVLQKYRSKIQLEISRGKKRKEMMSAGVSYDGLLQKLLAHVNYRVSAALRSAYPSASWEWKTKDPLRFVSQGGIACIRVYNIPNYAYFRVRLGPDASIVCEPINDPPQPAENTPQSQQTADPETWFETKGKETLTKLMCELNARGHSKLFLNEIGEVSIQPVPDGELIPQHQLDSFPKKADWPKLTELLKNAGLNAAQMNDSIQIAW